MHKPWHQARRPCAWVDLVKDSATRLIRGRPRENSPHRLWRLGVLLLLLGGWAGCRNQVRYELLERDLRFHEDEIYHLEDELSSTQARLDAARRENAALRRELAEQGETGSSGSGAGSFEPSGPPAVDLGTESPGPSPLEPQAPPYDGPPVIDPLPPEDAGGEPPPFVPPGGASSLDLDRLFQREPEEISDYQVRQVTLNQLLTGGHNTDGRLGDEGLLVVLEPRNEAGQVLNVPGDLSLVLLDPAQRGEAARVARWDYSADEVADRFATNVFGPGVRLELPWPGPPPGSSDLRLFARFTTADGQKFEVERTVHVELGPVPAGAWQTVVEDAGPALTPASGDRPAVLLPEPNADPAVGLSDGWSAGRGRTERPTGRAPERPRRRPGRR